MGTELTATGRSESTSPKIDPPPGQVFRRREIKCWPPGSHRRAFNSGIDAGSVERAVTKGSLAQSVRYPPSGRSMPLFQEPPIALGQRLAETNETLHPASAGNRTGYSNRPRRRLRRTGQRRSRDGSHRLAGHRAPARPSSTCALGARGETGRGGIAGAESARPGAGWSEVSARPLLPGPAHDADAPAPRERFLSPRLGGCCFCDRRSADAQRRLCLEAAKPDKEAA